MVQVLFGDDVVRVRDTGGVVVVGRKDGSLCCCPLFMFFFYCIAFVCRDVKMVLFVTVKLF